MPGRIDANVILRYLTNEPAEQAERSARLFGAVARGEREVLLEDVVLAEVVWTLASFYRMPRPISATRCCDFCRPMPFGQPTRMRFSWRWCSTRSVTST